MMRAEAWNAKYPVGTLVEYWPGSRPGESKKSRTRSEAWNLPAPSVDPHRPGRRRRPLTALVKVEGFAGGVALSHVEPIPADKVAAVKEELATEAQLQQFAEHWERPIEHVRHVLLRRGLRDALFMRVCRDCGCTDFDACYLESGDICHWSADDLCTRCAAKGD